MFSQAVVFFFSRDVLLDFVKLYRCFWFTVQNMSASDNYCISYAAILDSVWETILSLEHIHDYGAEKVNFPAKWRREHLSE